MGWKCPNCDLLNPNDYFECECGYETDGNETQVNTAPKFLSDNTLRIPYEILIFVITSYLVSIISVGFIPGSIFVGFWDSLLDLHLGEPGWGVCIVFAFLWPLLMVPTYIIIVSPFKKQVKPFKKIYRFLIVGIIESFLLSYFLATSLD